MHTQKKCIPIIILYTYFRNRRSKDHCGLNCLKSQIRIIIIIIPMLLKRLVTQFSYFAVQTNIILYGLNFYMLGKLLVV